MTIQISRTSMADALRAARIGLRITTRQLAEHAGCSRNTITRWEWGVTTPSLEMREKLVLVFSVYDRKVATELAEVFGARTPPEPESPRPKASAAAVARIDEAVLLGAAALGIPAERMRAGLWTVLMTLQDAGVSTDMLLQRIRSLASGQPGL